MPHFAWLVPCLLLALQPAWAAEPLDRLLAQLGNRDPKTRDLARKALEKLGPDALPALRKAAAHPDLEVRKRIAEIIPNIETAELIKPTIVSLRTEKKSARQLLDELSRQTGYKFEFWNDDAHQTHTLDLQDVPFWKAADAIGKLSGLAPMTGYGDDKLRFQKENGFPSHVSYDGAFRLVPTSFEYHRSLSFRRLGEESRPAQRSETLSLNYVIHSEPKLPMLTLGEPLVQEAIDSEGRALLQAVPLPNSGDVPGVMARKVARYGNGYATTSMQGAMTLGRPSEKARGLKLLRALIPVNLLAEQKVEVVTDRVLEMKKKKFKVGTTSFDIESCEKSKETGQYALKMSVTEANLGQEDYTWMNSLYRRVELVDENGVKYSNYGSSWSHSAPNHVQVTFNFGHPGKVGPPQKLTYQVWKTMSHQIKLELRDVPLP